MAVILHLDLHDFLVSVERKHDPALEGRPVIIGGQPTGWGRVVAASPEAAARGVKPGMSLSVAASRCPKAVFLDGAFDRYLDASAAIDELVREPGVPVEWTSVDSVFLDLTPRGSSNSATRSHNAGGGSLGAASAGPSGPSLSARGSNGLGSNRPGSSTRGPSDVDSNGPGSSSGGLGSNGLASGGPRSSDSGPSSLGSSGLFSSGLGFGRSGGGAPRQVAERVQAALRDQLGFNAACGIASTKIAAQIASRLARPVGLLYVLPGYEERLLAPLDVGLLPDLPPGIAPRLHRAGVLTLGRLASLDPGAAEALLGRRAGELARLARGLDDRVVDGAAPPRSVARDLTLPEPTQSPAELESVTQYLIETLATRVRRLGCFAQTVTVRLRGGTPERTYARSTTLREATATDGDLVATAHALLNLLRRQVRHVAGLTVVLSNLHQGGAQLPLFPLAPTGTPSTWTDLRGRSGFRALVHGHFVAQPAIGTRRAG